MRLLGQLALLALVHAQEPRILLPSSLWKWQVTPEANYQNCLEACEHPPSQLGKERCINGCNRKLCIDVKDKPRPTNCPDSLQPPDFLTFPVQKKWKPSLRTFFVPDWEKELNNCLTKGCKAPTATCTIEQCHAGCYGTYCDETPRPSACPDANLLWLMTSSYQKHPCDWPKSTLIENDLWL